VGVLRDIHSGQKFGVRAKEVGLEFSQLRKHSNEVIKELTSVVEKRCEAKKIRMIKGTGFFETPRKIRIKESGEAVEGDAIIIATGSVPVTLAGIGGVGTLNSDQALSLEKVPRSMVIIGGGYIGLEFAQIFHALGSEVTVLEMLSQLLPNEDADVAKELEGSLKKEGMRIFTKATVNEISGSDAHKVVRYTLHEKPVSLKTDCVLLAAGRRPFIEGLGLERVGVKTEQGRIVVNNNMQTTTAGIYAIGDVIGGLMLAHVATAEGRVAAEHIMGEGQPMDYTAVPRCIYTSPEAASVGLTEAEAKKKYGEIRVGRFPLSGLGKARIVGGFGFAKVISEKKFGRILGVHLVGPHVTDLIAEAAVAMNLECTSEEMAYTIHPHPTISEAMMEAAMSLMNT